MSQPTPRLYWAPGYTWQTPDVDIVWEEIEVASTGDGLYPDEGITTSRGRESLLDQFEAGELSATLVNIGRTFDPRYPSSPYVGKLLPGVPIKLTGQPDGEAEADVWRGTISGFPQHRDGPWATVPLQAFGLFDKTARAKLPASVYDVAVVADTPAAYWKLDDADNASMLDASGNRNHGVYDNSELGQDPLIADGGSSVLIEHTGDNRGKYRGDLAQAFPVTMEAWVKFPRNLAHFHSFVTINSGYTLVNFIAFACFMNGIGGYNNPNGAIGLAVFRSGATVRRAVGAIAVDDDEPHHVAVVATNASTWAFYVDGAADTLTDDVAGTPPSSWADSRDWGIGNFIDNFSGDFGIGGLIDNVAVYTTALSAGQMLAHYNAGAAPLAGQRTDERIAWTAEQLGLPADRLDLEAGRSLLGPAEFGDAKFVLDYWRLIERSEYGYLFENRHGQIRFLDRYWKYTTSEATTSQLTFTDDPNGAGIYHVASDPTLDDELVINVLTLSRRDGPEITVRDETSIAVYGELAGEPMTGLLLQTDTEVRSLGEHIVGTRSTAQPRIPSLRVPLHHLDPADATAVFNLEIGYRISVERNPLIGDAETLDFIIEKFDDEITPGEWWRELYLSPAPTPAAPDTEWIWDTSRWDIDTRWAPVLSIGHESALFVWDESVWDYTTRWAF